MSLDGTALDRWLTTDPREAAEGTYSASECNGTITDRRVQPADLTDRLEALIDLLFPVASGDRPTTAPKIAAQVARELHRLRVECEALPVAEEVDCSFEGGKVDAQFTGGRSAYTAHWTCPTCGKEHEEDREAGDDHPDL